VIKQKLIRAIYGKFQFQKIIWYLLIFSKITFKKFFFQNFKKNKPFADLFKYLAVERYLIPLGLYRLAGAVDNHHPYIYTNPPG